MTISYSARSYIIHGISSTNYFRQSPQLQKTTGTTSDHANIIDCFWNVQHVSLMLILFTEIFIVTFINDCAATTIFTISLLRLWSVNLLFNKRICVCVCVRPTISKGIQSKVGETSMKLEGPRNPLHHYIQWLHHCSYSSSYRPQSVKYG